MESIPSKYLQTFIVEVDVLFGIFESIITDLNYWIIPLINFHSSLHIYFKLVTNLWNFDFEPVIYGRNIFKH